LLKDARIETIVLNMECKDSIDELIDLIHFHKKKAGLSVNPDNHFYQLVPYFPQIDMLQIYTVEPGSQGMPFLPERLELIKQLRDFGFDCPIGVDGGIKAETIPLIKSCGVNILSVGGAIQKSENPLQSFRELCQLINES
jgi:pentose-5-phosphate-3-epimerase